MSSFIDLTGQKYGRLIALKRSENNQNKKVKWLCKCDCGNFTTVLAHQLRNGRTKSCGCLYKEHSAKINYKHGLAKTRLYRIWQNMKNRCYNPNRKCYEHYGGREIPIIVCDEWKYDFEKFRTWAISNGYKDNLTIGRKNVNGNYSPENCKWVLFSRQGENKRNTIYLTFDGKRQTLKKWSIETNILYDTLRHRVSKGWSAEKILSTPLKKYKNEIGRGESMKAFSLYHENERNLRLLLDKLKNYGKINCDFETFCRIYDKWHLKAFPGAKISTLSANFRDDWFIEFVNYIANVEIRSTATAAESLYAGKRTC